MNIRFAGMALLAALSVSAGTARADDIPSPCTALKHIVAARQDGFGALTPADGRGVSEPYGSDPRCSAGRGSYQCEWTPHQDAGTATDALEGVAADIASCLPDATHDVNSPSRQHFYLGERGNRTQITATTIGAGRVRLTVSGN
ncbi:hypothetical protein [Paraburkholderia caballeronis]|uniref:Uncharacterized protein n=1 Tax=Paraburkholderia caballeronis TaxID=416943 RepID=A0A1H7G6Z5_9BURK|nr:hypothetical protein [Paraburkholderia caballeronis]PXW24731.1 hypothetical protein C7403_10651 [Paraburkholderia caballeronis]PXX00461.1 hypothetical protein C7407_10651 [Paraburkholderia caballeronis]RAJ98524.1 hypothetical protein C7409_10651 [Paraburkholderia caballeronis]SEE65920.1 hypothetical protein SAMN05445871_5659 [Paraburkholderia caballeronis]SEK32582.1 hypothetical protein SAMN05192542_101584 [Paraburkholderia caballeronis]